MVFSKVFSTKPKAMSKSQESTTAQMGFLDAPWRESLPLQYQLNEMYKASVANRKSVSLPSPAVPSTPPTPVDIGHPLSSTSPKALIKGKFVTLPLERRTEISHDTRIFRFALPSQQHELGLPVGQHLFIKAKNAAGESVMRAYTPMGCGLGYVDFVIKVYFANVHPKFPDGGKLTQILDAMKVGDTIDVKGPLGEWIFHTTLTLPKAPGAIPTFVEFTTKVETGFDSIGFIAGGSGITPVLQTAHALVADKDAKITIKILFANRTVEDILCKDLLDALEKDPRVKVWYTLDVQPETEWKYSMGFINEEMIKQSLPPPVRARRCTRCPAHQIGNSH